MIKLQFNYSWVIELPYTCRYNPRVCSLYDFIMSFMTITNEGNAETLHFAELCFAIACKHVLDCNVEIRLNILFSKF